MPDEAQATVCEGCRRGQVIKRREETAFRQRSDIGFIHCRVAVLIGVCDVCDARWVDPGADKIFDEAFQQEYERKRLVVAGQDRSHRNSGGLAPCDAKHPSGELTCVSQSLI